MLSNETKLNRINERLFPYNLKLEFSCYDLKTYTPSLFFIDLHKSLYCERDGFCFKINVGVEKNKVVLYISKIFETDFSHYFGAINFLFILNSVKNDLKYCNSLGLEVPKYTRG